MATLYDHRGNPVRNSGLSREQAYGNITSVRSPYSPTVAIGLTPAKLVQMIQAAKDGSHFEYLDLAHEMEERDAHYFSVLQTRKLAVVQLEMTVEPVSDDPQDVKEAAAITDLIVKRAAFRESLIHIVDGLGKGFSVVEMLWYKKPDVWCPSQFLWRKQRWFQFDRETASELRIYDGTIDGVKMDPYKFILHKPHVFSGTSLASGLARVVAAYHLFKSFAIRDWMAFAEIFGIPIRIGRYDTEATDDDKEMLRTAVRDIGSDAAAIIPKNVEIEFVRAAQSGFAGSDSFFAALTGWINKEISKVVLGQTMTTEDGSSLGQAKVHEQVRNDIRNADAHQLENTLNRDVAKPFTDLNFGSRDEETMYPKIKLDTSEPEDLEMLSKSLPPFIDRGMKVAARVVADKFKLPEPEARDLLLTPMVKAAPSPDGKPGDSPNLMAELSQLVKETTNLRVFRTRYTELLQRHGETP